MLLADTLSWAYLPEIRPYFSFQDELSYQDRIVFRGECAVIPDAPRKEITHPLHSSHLRVEGCLGSARECVHWLDMNDQIKTHIAKCDICRSVDCKQHKETLQPHKIPSRPWEKVGMDLNYLSSPWTTTQTFGKYLPETKSTTVIRKLKAHFTRQGIPDIVLSDNGPQYSSQEFQRFSQLWEFQHKTSSPGYGKAESAVKTAKRLLLNFTSFIFYISM